MALVIGSVPPGFFENDPNNGVVIPLPPKNGGDIRWGGVWLSFGMDHGNSAQLRVAVFNDHSNSWRVEGITVNRDAPRSFVGIVEGDSKVSVGRLRSGSGLNSERCPIGWMLEAFLQNP